MKRKNIIKRLLCISLVFIMLCSTNTTSVFASDIPDIQISYDGEVKIISNIPNEYLKSEQSKRSSSKVIIDFLKEIGYDQEQIDEMPESTINEYINAKKIYSICKEKTFYEKTANQRSTIDPPLEIERSNAKVVFTVTENSSLINGRKAFKLKTTVDWENINPTWRLKDIIAMAWTSNALSCGTARSSHTMIYDRSTWAEGVLIGSESNIVAPSSSHWEINNFPDYAVMYDLPSNDLIPQRIYSDFHLRAETMVTATGDFVACSGYGHQIIAGSPSVSISSSGDFGLGLDFNYVMDEFYVGSIRVYL